MSYDCTRLDYETIFRIALYCRSDVFNCSAQSPGLTGLDYWTLLLIAPSTSGPQQQCPRVSAPDIDPSSLTITVMRMVMMLMLMMMILMMVIIVMKYTKVSKKQIEKFLWSGSCDICGTAHTTHPTSTNPFIVLASHPSVIARTIHFDPITLVLDSYLPKFVCFGTFHHFYRFQLKIA